jgi:hypothetical protein
MAAYAKEEEENEKAQRAMREKIEEHKRQLAEKKAARVCLQCFVFRVYDFFVPVFSDSVLRM